MVRFYIYAYLNTDKPGVFNITTSVGNIQLNYEPVYIGKGVDRRMESHTDDTHNEELRDVIKEKKYEFLKLYENLPSHQAYAIESELIYKIGRKDLGKGPLVNKSSGIHLVEADASMNITPFNLELNKILHVVDVLNNSKTIRECSDKLKLSERTLYRYINSYKLKKIDGSWIQAL